MAKRNNNKLTVQRMGKLAIRIQKKDRAKYGLRSPPGVLLIL